MHFNNRERRKLLENVCAYFFNLDPKHLIINFSYNSFFQHDMKAETSTELFQNNKICTSSCSKICSGDVHALDLFPIFTPFLNIVPLKKTKKQGMILSYKLLKKAK